MYYRIFADSPNVYPGYGYNLQENDLHSMATWYLESLYPHVEDGNMEQSEFESKMKLYETADATLIESEIENFLSNYDGKLTIEKSENPFDEAECDDLDEMNNRPWN